MLPFRQPLAIEHLAIQCPTNFLIIDVLARDMEMLKFLN